MNHSGERLLAAVILVCIGFLPVLALFSSMLHVTRGNLRLARILCVAGLAGSGLQWLAVFAFTRYFTVTMKPAAMGPDALGWILRLPPLLLLMVGFSVATTLGSVLLNAHIEKEQRRREEEGGEVGDGSSL